MVRTRGRRLDILQRRLFGVIGEKGTAKREFGGALSVGHEAEVADAVETIGQRVKEEAADELVGLQLHDLGDTGLAIVLPGEGDMIVVEGDEAALVSCL